MIEISSEDEASRFAEQRKSVENARLSNKTDAYYLSREGLWCLDRVGLLVLKTAIKHLLSKQFSDNFFLKKNNEQSCLNPIVIFHWIVYNLEIILENRLNKIKKLTSSDNKFKDIAKNIIKLNPVTSFLGINTDKNEISSKLAKLIWTAQKNDLKKLLNNTILILKRQFLENNYARKHDQKGLYCSKTQITYIVLNNQSNLINCISIENQFSLIPN